MVPPDPTRLAFDDVVIDLAGHRLVRGGIEQALEPKAFGVLALLARAPGRVFARDDILDAVWGHRHVTPGVLNRVMTLLRHALGEDAHSPRYLHTVHGVGYRFDLPPLDEALAETVTSVQADPDTTVAATVQGSAPATDAPRQRRATDGRKQATPRRWPWLLALVSLLVLAGLAFLHWRVAPAPAPANAAPAAAPPPTLAVLPLKGIGDDPGVRTIAEGLSEELIGSLARIDGLRVIARESTRVAAAESTAPAALAQRLGISHALEGSLQQAGQRLRIRLRLIDTRTGAMLWTRDFDRDASEVLALQRDIAQAVAASLALRLGLGAAPKQSGDAEFLRRFMAARALVNRRDLPLEASTERAEGEFRALLRERPDDARVHAALATALEVRAIRKQPLAASLREESMREAGLALQLDPGLAEPYWVRAGAACRGNDWERCLALQAKARLLGAEATDSQIITLGRLGYLDRALHAQRELLASDPINGGRHFLLARLLDTAGRHDEALAHHARTNISGSYARWFNAVWRHDLAGALRIAESEIGAPDAPDYASRYAPAYQAVSRALVDPALWPRAIAEMGKTEKATGLWNFCRVLAPDAPAHAAEHIARLDEARQRGYSSWDLLLWTHELTYLRRDPTFQDYLRDNGILAYWKRHGFPRQCRPQGDGAVCE
ncbi:MAG: hypothetical protein EOP93_00095 [Lysobacteraceae bacterium]|nr:MAG: hypothetical protein EOP93_00095 [Xanthomonadaceae bacterium]